MQKSILIVVHFYNALKFVINCYINNVVITKINEIIYVQLQLILNKVIQKHSQ